MRMIFGIFGWFLKGFYLLLFSPRGPSFQQGLESACWCFFSFSVPCPRVFCLKTLLPSFFAVPRIEQSNLDSLSSLLAPTCSRRGNNLSILSNIQPIKNQKQNQIIYSKWFVYIFKRFNIQYFFTILNVVFIKKCAILFIYNFSILLITFFNFQFKQFVLIPGFSFANFSLNLFVYIFYDFLFTFLKLLLIFYFNFRTFLKLTDLIICLHF